MKILDLSDRTNMFYWQSNRRISADEINKIFLNRHKHTDETLIKQAVNSGMVKAGYSGKDALVKNIKEVIKRGLVNTVIPITLESGKEIIIRMHPQNVKNGYFWVESLAAKLAKEIGVPTYNTLIVDDSMDTVPFDFMIMSKEKGKPLQDLLPLDAKIEKKIISETGKFAALIHSIKIEGFGFFKNKLAKNMQLVGQYETFRDHFYAALDEDMKFLTDHEVLTKKNNKAINFVFNKNDLFLNIDKASLIHNDIADWNELSDGKKITGIMDWDECFAGDPLMELAAYNLFFGEPRMTWFKNGYTKIKKLEVNEDKFQIFKLRYLLSKMHLRKKLLLVQDIPQIQKNLVRGLEAMNEIFAYFKLD